MNSHPGEIIKQILKDEGKNVEWLAQQLGISKQSLYKTLRKDSYNTDTLQKIAKVLDVTPSIFYSEDYTAFSTTFLQKKIYDNQVINNVITRLKNLSFLIDKNKAITPDQINFEINDIISEYEKADDKYIEYLLSAISMDDKNKIISYLEEIAKEKPSISDIETTLKRLIEIKSNQ